MKRYTTVLILFVSAGVSAQKGDVSISFCPLAALDAVSFPTIQGGVEWRIGRRFSWYNEFGVEYMASRIAVPDTAIVRPWGIKAKSELRYYVATTTYFALNAFLTADAHNTGLLYHSSDTMVERTDAIGVHKHVYGWNFLLGQEVRLGGRFSLDMYAGFGIRLRHIQTVGMQFDSTRDGLITAIDLNFHDTRMRLDSQPGWSAMPNITAGVRVVCRL